MHLINLLQRSLAAETNTEMTEKVSKLSRKVDGGKEGRKGRSSEWMDEKAEELAYATDVPRHA